MDSSVAETTSYSKNLTSVDVPEHSSRLAGASQQLRMPDANFKSRPLHFMGIVRKRDDLSSLLESMFIAYLLKKRHPYTSIALLVHTDNQKLALASRLFDRVYSYTPGAALRESIQTEKAGLVYIPYQDIHAQIASVFSSFCIRTPGFGRSSLSRFFRLPQIGEEDGLSYLQRHGYDLTPEAGLPYISKKLSAASIPLPRGNFVWLSLFEEHNLNSYWPAAYIARLSRLLHKANVKTAISLPDMAALKKRRQTRKIQAQIDFLNAKGADIHFLEKLYPQERAAGMQRALAVLGPSGPELALASLLRRPVVTLHDMRSHSFQTTGKTPLNLKTKTNSKSKNSLLNFQAGKNGNHGSKTAFWQNPRQKYQKNLMRYLYSPYTQQRHITPIVEECIVHCVRCPHNSCVEYISPEQVFENLKKLDCL